MRIVIDANIPLGKAFFSTLGEVVPVPPREISHNHLRNADALIVRSVKTIDKALVNNTSLKFVGTCTAGFDHLDTKALDELGVAWTNAPGCNANSVVEYVFSALSALDIQWSEKKIGIVGCGQVGGLLLQRLLQFNAECICYDPYLNRSDNPYLTDFDDLFECDVICIHAPYTFDAKFPSHHLFNQNNLSKLQPGAVLINAGRGGVVDNQALKQLVPKRPDLTVVLDVWENEPSIDSQLLDLVNIATPHIAGHSIDGKIKGTSMIYQKLCEFLEVKPAVSTEQLDSGVNMQPIIIDEQSTQAAVASAVLNAYHAKHDSLKWINTIKEKALADSFDAYRKHYPERREFYHHSVQLKGECNNELCRHQLTALGFTVL